MNNDFTALDDAPDLRAQFDRTIAGEPHFRTPHVSALDAAERGGRRRRARVLAGRGIAVVGCLALVGGIAASTVGASAGSPSGASVASGGVEATPSAVVSASAVATPVLPIPGTKPGGADWAPDLTKLRSVAETLAALAPGSTTSFDPVQQTDRSVNGLVTTPWGRYQLTITGLTSHGQSTINGQCVAEPSATCQGSAVDSMETLTGFGKLQEKRSDVFYDYDLSKDRSLQVHVSNMVVDNDSGVTTFGPDAARAGITYQALQAIAKASGL